MMNEEIKRIVMGLRPIDDDFMKAIFTDNKPLVEYVLRVILGKDDLIVETSETQHDLNFFGSRSLTLDVFAKDSTGKSFNSEPDIIRQHLIFPLCQKALFSMSCPILTLFLSPKMMYSKAIRQLT